MLTSDAEEAASAGDVAIGGVSTTSPSTHQGSDHGPPFALPASAAPGCLWPSAPPQRNEDLHDAGAAALPLADSVDAAPDEQAEGVFVQPLRVESWVADGHRLATLGLRREMPAWLKRDWSLTVLMLPALLCAFAICVVVVLEHKPRRRFEAGATGSTTHVQVHKAPAAQADNQHDGR